MVAHGGRGGEGGRAEGRADLSKGTLQAGARLLSLGTVLVENAHGTRCDGRLRARAHHLLRTRKWMEERREGERERSSQCALELLAITCPLERREGEGGETHPQEGEAPSFCRTGLLGSIACGGGALDVLLGSGQLARKRLAAPLRLGTRRTLTRARRCDRWGRRVGGSGRGHARKPVH